MTETVSEAEHFARKLILQAAWPALVIAVLVVMLAMTSADHGLAAPAWYSVTAGVAAVSALATLALSVLLLFDALLFRVIASHTDEREGCAAVDDILTRMRLKPGPVQTRGLAERIAGTRRIVLMQRTAIAIFAATTAAFVFARTA